MLHIILLFTVLSITNAFIFNFQQEQRKPKPKSYEEQTLESECLEYLCPDTLTCVPTPDDCPCPLPRFQLRCILPDGHYVCISKPATNDKKLSALYDDPVKGPGVQAPGMRDCGWVLKAYQGLV